MRNKKKFKDLEKIVPLLTKLSHNANLTLGISYTKGGKSYEEKKYS